MDDEAFDDAALKERIDGLTDEEFAEKELTIIFSDTEEERFLRVQACAECGQVSFTVDYNEDVQP